MKKPPGPCTRRRRTHPAAQKIGGRHQKAEQGDESGAGHGIVGPVWCPQHKGKDRSRQKKTVHPPVKIAPLHHAPPETRGRKIFPRRRSVRKSPEHAEEHRSTAMNTAEILRRNGRLHARPPFGRAWSRIRMLNYNFLVFSFLSTTMPSVSFGWNFMSRRALNFSTNSSEVPSTGSLSPMLTKVGYRALLPFV